MRRLLQRFGRRAGSRRDQKPSDTEIPGSSAVVGTDGVELVTCVPAKCTIASLDVLFLEFCMRILVNEHCARFLVVAVGNWKVLAARKFFESLAPAFRYSGRYPR